MNKTVKLIAALALVPLLALAGTPVDQGQPGNQGPWKVTLVGSSSTSTTTSGANTYAPTKTRTVISSNATACTAAGGASCTIVLASTEIISWPRLAITMKNAGANALSNVLVEFSPDGTSWEVWDTSTFGTLATGVITSIQIDGNSRRYIRIEARSASGTTTDVWLTGSQG